VRIGGEADGEGEQPVDVERPRITFADVGGMEAIKEDIRLKIIAPVEHAELYKAYGKTAGGGILLFGPPGCGKTYLARATAGEMGRGFISVGISDVLDMWLGQSERNLRDIFDGARAHQPCVLFFDEVDALAASRTDLRHSAGRNVVNQFLSELDGIESSNEGVLVLAATNAPWHLDPAFRRPGRFDRVIFVPPPDAPARSAILRILLRDKPATDVDVSQVAAKLDLFSGADLKGLVDLAVEGKLGEAMRTGIPTPLRTKDLLDAARTVTHTTKEWFATARNHVLYANQAGLYDAVRPWLKM
jgi:SpoVK/Ycf46/Vps4 family AAA+-type ATPase